MPEKTRFSEELALTLEIARDYASGDVGESKYSDVHVLLALLNDDENVGEFVASCDHYRHKVKPEDLVSALMSVLDMAPAEQLQYIQDAESLEEDFHQYCAHAGIDNATGISFLNYIAGLNTWCGRNLYESGFTPDLITSYLNSNVQPDGEVSQRQSNSKVLTLPAAKSDSGQPGFDANEADNQSIVDQFCTILSPNDKPDYVSGDIEIPGLYETLSRKYKNNAALMGTDGDTATAMAHALAWQCAKGYVPQTLENMPVYQLDLEQFLKTINTFDSNQRVQKTSELAKRILNSLEKLEPRPVLFVDNMVAPVKTTTAQSKDIVTIANLGDVFSTQSQVPVIGAMTPEFSNNKELRDTVLSMTNFDAFNIEHLAKNIEKDQTRAELEGLKQEYEQYYGLDVADEAIDTIVQAQKQLDDRNDFYEAGDLLDEVCAAKQAQSADASGAPDTLTGDDAIAFFERRYGIKQHMLHANGTAITPETFERSLKDYVIGQDEAIRTLTDGFKRNEAGVQLSSGTKGNYLFAGPTGVGKTELARTLADVHGYNLIKEDMEHYQREHEVSKLIGAPPGYVGYDQGGALINKLKASQGEDGKANAVVLLDEIEKANPKVFDALLPLLSEGVIQDSDGNAIDASNVVVVMTSNVGQHELQQAIQQEKESGIGFTASLGAEKDESDNDAVMSEERVRDIVNEKIRKEFKPEFRNRLTATVHFSHLSRENLDQILDNVRQKLEDQYAYNVTLEFTKAAREHLIEEGYSHEMGARHLNRTVETHLGGMLADAFHDGQVENGQYIQVDYDTGKSKLVLNFDNENNRHKLKAAEQDNTSQLKRPVPSNG